MLTIVIISITIRLLFAFHSEYEQEIVKNELFMKLHQNNYRVCNKNGQTQLLTCDGSGLLAIFSRIFVVWKRYAREKCYFVVFVVFVVTFNIN